MLSLLICAALSSQAEEGFVPLFDGRDLEGWRVAGTGRFTVEDGEIRARAEKKSFLVSERSYGDFELRLETLVEDGGNSGIQFRSQVAENGTVSGYQAEVDTSDRKWAGGLYDEGRRGWLNPLEGKPGLQAAFRNGEWNEYRIRCEGDHLRIWLNGVLTTDYHDSLSLTGVLGLQHHGEKDKVYRWRNLRIRDLGAHQWKPLLDAKTLDDWRSNGAGTWSVEDGGVVGRAAQEERHGLLFGPDPVDDFTLRLRFRSLQGNSGLYFRVQEVEGGAGCQGPQAEIDPAAAVGGIYETGGRGWLVQPTPEDLKQWLKTDDWNVMTVSAHGGRVVVHLNGHLTADLDDDRLPTQGLLALQLHGGQDVELRVQDLMVLAPRGDR